jgi:serine/threonine-protein kinase
MALVHAGLGHQELALDWLDRAYESRDVHLAFLPVDPKWDAFRSDPRFIGLLRRCNFNRSAIASRDRSEQTAKKLA